MHLLWASLKWPTLSPGSACKSKISGLGFRGPSSEWNYGAVFICIFWTIEDKHRIIHAMRGRIPSLILLTKVCDIVWHPCRWSLTGGRRDFLLNCTLSLRHNIEDSRPCHIFSHSHGPGFWSEQIQWSARQNHRKLDGSLIFEWMN